MSWSLDPEVLRDLISVQKLPLSQASAVLQSMYPEEQGLSERQIRRICTVHGIQRLPAGLTDAELDDEVTAAANEVY